MPKIDVSKIEGWDGLDTEARLKALMEFDIPENVDMSKFISKEAFDKTASECASWKKKFNDTLSESERKSAEEAEKAADFEKKYTELQKKLAVSDFTKKYLAMGYDEKEAGEMANAQADGDSEKMFELMTNHATNLEKKIKEDLLKNSPKPDGAGHDDGKDKTADVLLAEKLGKAALERDKAANDIVNKFV